MTGYIILLAVIAILMVIGFVRARREKKREFEQKMDAITMPCGELGPSNDELLTFTEEDFDKYSREDLFWLINYIGHAIPEDAHDENEPWSRIFILASNVKNKKKWYSELDHVVDY